MNRLGPIYRLISGPPGLALVFWILLLLLLPDLFSRYKISEEIRFRKVQGYNNLSAYLYQDLNNDGIPEFLEFEKYKTNANFLVNSDFDSYLEVYNLPGHWYMDKPLFSFGDIDRDGITEVFCITIDNTDSIIASYIEPFGEEIIHRKTILGLKRHNEVLDATIIPFGLTDNNGDGTDEFIFSVNAGFTLQPRGIFAWDIRNDSVYRSPVMGAAIKSGLIRRPFYDLDGDGVVEMFPNISAPANHKDEVEYTDHYAWGMVFTKNLEFLFPPISFPDSGSWADIGFMNYDGKNFIVCGVKNVHHSATLQGIYLLDQSGNVVKKRNFKAHRTYDNQIYANEKLYLFRHEDEYIISVLDDSLNDISVRRFDKSYNYLWDIDIDLDGKTEILIFSWNENSIKVLNSDLSERFDLTYHLQYPGVNYISSRLRDGKFELMVDNQEDLRSYIISSNPFFLLKYPSYILLYLVLFLVFRFFYGLWEKQINQRRQLEQDIIQYQLQATMNQLEPHFTFNTLSSIGSTILEEDKQTAYKHFTGLSRLIRKSMDYAYHPTKTLEEELEFIDEYLKLQQFRFPGKFEFRLEVAETINTGMDIPKMLLQTFVENSVKHGIYRLKKEGLIELIINSEKHKTVAIIRDNGIGRKAASSNGSSSGEGLKILTENIELFNRLYRRNISYSIEDLCDHEGHPDGTEVRVMLD